VVKDFPLEQINDKYPHCEYSAWQLLEHIRIAQWDILDFIRNPNYRELEWPREYWPGQQTASAADWARTLADFARDQQELIAIASNQETDLYSKIPHGSGQTVFRELILVGDHNAYHFGEFAILRQVMGTWR
jgi:hypothetical protein